MNKLASSRVAVFGLGGVGGHAMEALARSGIGAIDLIDYDKVDVTNLNRQIIATVDTIGQDKTEAAARRVAAINPDCKVTVHSLFFLPDSAGCARADAASRAGIDFSAFDYVVDAIDTVAGKLALIEAARDAGVPIICSMGAGNKLDASAFRVADIYKTKVCPLAKVIRRECRKRGIESLKVVYSEEEPITPRYGTGALQAGDGAGVSQAGDGVGASQAGDGAGVSQAGDRQSGGRRPPGSVAFAPAVAGLIMAGEVVRDLCGITRP